MNKVIMPKLGPDMESGIIQKWLKKEGVRVRLVDYYKEV